MKEVHNAFAVTAADALCNEKTESAGADVKANNGRPLRNARTPEDGGVFSLGGVYAENKNPHSSESRADLTSP